MKSFYFFVCLFVPHFLPGQDLGNLNESVDTLVDTIKKIFPLVMLIIFLIGFAFNAGYFFGENQDMKKGISRILIFVAILGTVAGIASYILAITL